MFDPVPKFEDDIPELQPVEVEVPDVSIRKPPHPGFWWAVLWCLGFLTVTQVIPTVISTMYIALALLQQGKGFGLDALEAWKAAGGVDQSALLTIACGQVLSLMMGYGVVRLFLGRDWPHILAVRLPLFGHLLLCLLAFPAFLFLSSALEDLSRRMLPEIIDVGAMIALFGKWPWPVGVLIIGLGPGIGEELWCRGFLGRGIVARHGVWVGVVLTSLLFAAMHLEPRQVFCTFFIGLVLHATYLATRSLLVPIILHFANNSLAILLLHYDSLKILNARVEQVPWSFYAATVVLFVSAGWTLFATRARLVNLPVKEPWHVDYPTVELPPLGSGSRVEATPGGRLPWLITLIAAAFFGYAFLQFHAAFTNPVQVDLGWQNEGGGHQRDR